MKLLLRSRRVEWVIGFVVVFELSLILWGDQALVIRHSESVYAVPTAVLAQFLPAAAITYATGSELDTLEQGTSRNLWIYRGAGLLGAVLVAVGATALTCAMVGPAGTLDAWAPVRSLLGLTGAALIASLVVDRRAAAVVAVVLVMFPLVFDPDATPGGVVLGFTVQDPGVALTWVVSVGLAVIGLVSRSVAPSGQLTGHRGVSILRARN